MKRWYILDHLIAKNSQWNTYVELGVWKGKTLLHLARKYSHTLTLYGIDLWEPQPNGKCETYIPNENGHEWDHKKYFKDLNNLINNEKLNIKLIQEDTVKAAKFFEDNTVDLIFIDADHSYEGCISDIKAWLPKIKTGGYITGHDYGDKNFPGVIQAVNEMFPNGIETYDDFVWVKKIYN